MRDAIVKFIDLCRIENGTQHSSTQRTRSTSRHLGCHPAADSTAPSHHCHRTFEFRGSVAGPVHGARSIVDLSRYLAATGQSGTNSTMSTSYQDRRLSRLVRVHRMFLYDRRMPSSGSSVW